MSRPCGLLILRKFLFPASWEVYPLRRSVSSMLSLLGVLGSSPATPSFFNQANRVTACSFSPGDLPAGFGAAARVPAVQRFDLAYSTPNPDVIEVRLASKASGGTLLFIGSKHITPPDPGLFAYLEGAFARENPTESYIEVSDTSYLQALPSEKEDVIRTRGEPSYLGYVARHRQVPVLPLEPKASTLFEAIRQRFSADEIALAHILREVQIARDRRRLFGEALEGVAARSIVERSEVARGAGKELSFKNILGLTQATDRLWPGLDWRQVPAEWSNPLLESSATGSRFVNSVFREEKTVRDRHVLRLLLSRVAAGQRVIALAGRTHAQSHLEALSCLMASY